MATPPSLVHYAARTRDGRRVFLDFEKAAWMWARLRARFPRALASVLMPEHLHLLAHAGRSEELRQLLARFAQRFGYGPLWGPVNDSPPIVAHEKVARNVRYIHLNPSRRGLSLPLEWAWSTHRDIVGASALPWVTEPSLHPYFEWAEENFRQRFHAYVSSDPTVSVEGTRLPNPQSFACLDRMALAACASHLSQLAAITRRGRVRTTFCALAVAGNAHIRAIARRCELHPESVTRAAVRCPPEWLAAAQLCLGDERLTRYLSASPGELRDRPAAWRRHLSARSSRRLAPPSASSPAWGT